MSDFCGISRIFNYSRTLLAMHSELPLKQRYIIALLSRLLKIVPRKISRKKNIPTSFGAPDCSALEFDSESQLARPSAVTPR